MPRHATAAIGHHYVAPCYLLEQAELLVRMGCTRCQGFLFSRPVHAREIDVMLTEAGEEWWPQPAKLVAGPRG
jgi:predicted signal transduction protein with EAL and GGDEF domain